MNTIGRSSKWTYLHSTHNRGILEKVNYGSEMALIQTQMTKSTNNTQMVLKHNASRQWTVNLF